jgi:hypothetical protein
MAEGMGNSLLHEKSRISAALPDRNRLLVYRIGVPSSTMQVTIFSIIRAGAPTMAWRASSDYDRPISNSESPPNRESRLDRSTMPIACRCWLTNCSTALETDDRDNRIAPEGAVAAKTCLVDPYPTANGLGDARLGDVQSRNRQQPAAAAISSYFGWRTLHPVGML